MMQSYFAVAAVLSVFLSAGALAANAERTQNAAKPLTAGELAPALTGALSKVREDPPPPKIVRGIHYVISNENRHYLYRDAVTSAGEGGMYIGVGTDQNYLIAGWSRPDVLVLFDFDQVVVDLHRVYRQAFLHAPDREAFLQLWTKDQSALRELIDQADESPAVRTRMHQALTIAKKAVPRRLARVKKLYSRINLKSFLTDDEQYRYLVEMFRSKRVFMYRGDLTAERTMNDLAEVARTHKIPVRGLYMSNAERYFRYSSGFKKSMLNLPLDERSTVLRTSDYNRHNYQYSSQSGANFHAWLRHDGTTSAKKMLAYKEYPRTKPGEETLAFIKVMPDRYGRLPPLPVVQPQPGDRIRAVVAKRPRAERAATEAADLQIRALGAAVFF